MLKVHNDIATWEKDLRGYLVVPYPVHAKHMYPRNLEIELRQLWKTSKQWAV